MTAFFKLIRWQNLVIVILTQVMVRYLIISPVAGTIDPGLISPGLTGGLDLQLPFIDFLILVFSTVCITAGGYVINDYFDIKTDLVNRGEVLVGRKIPRRRVMMWHNLLNIIGVLGGFWISFRIGYLWAGVIFLLVSGLLYFYSASYKKQFLIGNLIVALLTALVPLMVAAYEIPAIYRYYNTYGLELKQLLQIFYWVAGLSVFAFLATLAREIIKDIEDFEGDSAYGSRSLPVVIGINTSKAVASVIIASVILLLGLVWIQHLKDILSLIYIIVIICIPMVVNIIILLRGKDSAGFHTASILLKLIMLGGIAYSIIIWLVVEKGFHI